MNSIPDVVNNLLERGFPEKAVTWVGAQHGVSECKGFKGVGEAGGVIKLDDGQRKERCHAGYVDF